jgi:lipoprotein-anchoring transpeptidase ErfK/SrfK
MTLTPVPRESEQAAPTNALNALYGPVSGERFPIPAVRLADIHPEYLRKTVFYPTREQPGTIVIDPQNHFLYLIQGGGRALRYGVGVGRQGLWVVGGSDHSRQAGMAGLVSAQGDD